MIDERASQKDTNMFIKIRHPESYVIFNCCTQNPTLIA